jgi:glycosyltransferase involved in cell wall biosynthesis
MRISIDAGVLLKERSGVGQYLYNLINGLGAVDTTNEYRLLYGSYGRSIRNLPRFPYLNFSCQRIPCPAKLLKLASGVGRWRLPAFGQLFGSADVFHWPNYLLIPGGSGKHIITICDLTFLMFPAYHPPFRVQAYSAGITRSAARADAIIVISQHTKQDVLRHLRVPEEKIHVVYCAPSPRFQPILPHDGAPVLSNYFLQRQKYVLFVGNIEPRKNIVRLLEAYARLTTRWRHAYPLVLVGGRGWRNKDIYKKIEELSLEQDVRFLGYVPDDILPALMSGAAFFVYPSLYEGFGMPPLEAMACGTPVITSNASSLPEVVGDAALLIDPHDVEGLTEAMHRALKQRGLREELRERGLARAKLFSWEKTACQTLNVYERVHCQQKSV